MSPEEFKENWEVTGEAIVSMPSSHLDGLGLNPQSVSFLSIAGLPDGASPFLSFAQRGGSSSYCVRLTELYDFLPPEHERYISIGFDGSGNPVAIDTADDDRVVWLDHEDDFAKSYMNASVSSLAQFLLMYRDFVLTLLKSKGDDAFLDGDFTQEEFDSLRSKLEDADPIALKQGHFWEMELRTLMSNRRT